MSRAYDHTRGHTTTTVASSVSRPQPSSTAVASTVGVGLVTSGTLSTVKRALTPSVCTSSSQSRSSVYTADRGVGTVIPDNPTLRHEPLRAPALVELGLDVADTRIH